MFHLPHVPLDDPAWLFAVLAFAVLAAPPLARLIRLPDIVGLVLAGTIIGPTGLGLVERAGLVETLGTAGLLYLMFVAGLELDLHQLVERRRDSLVFGFTTFAIPMAVSIPVILMAGFDLLAAVLLASCWASHTLLTYPVFRRYGVATNRAVAATVGATILTDTAALLVLVVVVRAFSGALTLSFWPVLLASLTGLGVFTLWLLPRVARWLFTVAGRDRTPRLVFLLFALFASSAVAELAGIEAIIGAFLAGLSLNRLVPGDSILMERVEVLGNSILIPLFLISVGMLVDPMLLVQPSTLATAAIFVALAIGTKWLAAEGTGRYLGFDAAERGSMFSLSGAQAAATLAAVFVGLEVELLGPDVVNAVIVVILVTSLVTSWSAERSAPRLPAPPRNRTIGQTVVVPVVNPATARPLAVLAAAIARRDGGIVVPVTVVPPDADPEQVERAEELSVEAEHVAMATGVEASGLTRVDRDPASGILHTVRQTKATLLVLGWKGRSRTGASSFGGLTDAIVNQASAATLIARVQREDWGRVVVAVSAADLEPRGLPSVHLALSVAQRLVRDANREVLVVTERDDRTLRHLAEDILGAGVEVADRRRRNLRDGAREDDLVIVAAQPDVRGMQRSAARLARELPETDLVTAIDHRPLAARFRAGRELIAQVDGRTDEEEAPSREEPVRQR
jgi:Kef-type K+ transport system membrane component KefB